MAAGDGLIHSVFTAPLFALLTRHLRILRFASYFNKFPPNLCAYPNPLPTSIQNRRLRRFWLGSPLYFLQKSLKIAPPAGFARFPFAVPSKSFKIGASGGVCLGPHLHSLQKNIKFGASGGF